MENRAQIPVDHLMTKKVLSLTEKIVGCPVDRDLEREALRRDRLNVSDRGHGMQIDRPRGRSIRTWSGGVHNPDRR